ncbi:MAG: hypothetical protein JWQ09_5834 [Segetibacter sp.]|nr:hypothetical protein [Segetibacter sp.]
MYKPPKQPSLSTLQKQVDDFNSKFIVDEIVNVKNDDGTITTDCITHEATIMGGHTAMAWLEHKGSYLLNRVSKV